MDFSRTVRTGVLVLIAHLLTACGSSQDVPYLVSSPEVSYAANAGDPSRYDVTVTIGADSNGSIDSASLYIVDTTDSAKYQVLHLINTGGTTWSNTTPVGSPIASGTYVIDRILLYEANYSGNWTADYSISPSSSTHYTVTQDGLESGMYPVTIYHGVSKFPITEYTLP